MVKDIYLRLIAIPLLGILIPFASGVVSYRFDSYLRLFASGFYYILLSFIIWTGCHWIHKKLRSLFLVRYNPISKIFSISLVSTVYSALISGTMTIIWFRVSGELFNNSHFYLLILFTILAVLIFTLIYEILFLSREREIDTSIVSALDKDRKDAELSVLKNELDPHFMLNAMSALNHLITTDPKTAHMYNSRLASVYHYFLVNKQNELVTLQNEMEFIKDYFSILHLRYEDSIVLDAELDPKIRNLILLPPCAIHTLVENAIKHNEFSIEYPLRIKIDITGQYLHVSNNIKPKPYLVTSTKIGLNNLRDRYLLLCNKNITIEKNSYRFVVKLPVIFKP